MLIVAIVIYYLESRSEGQSNNNGTLDNETSQTRPNITESYMFNEFLSIKVDGVWRTRIKDRYNTSRQYYSAMHFGPKELSNMTQEGIFIWNNPLYNHNKSLIMVAYDPNDTAIAEGLTLAGPEFINNAMVISRGFQYEDLNVTAGCVRECKDLPLVTCASDSTVRTLYLKQSNQTKVVFDGSCITVSGDNLGVIKGTEFVLYTMFGVMG